jgi:ribonuclease BN (tRNA processing enzyme)
MKLIVLGSASGLPVPERNSSSFWIETSESAFLIDAGDGAARQVVRYGLDPNRLEGVFISHMHSDHASGLFMLLQLMHLTGRKKPFRIYLPEGVLPGFESVFPYFQIFKEKWPYAFDLLPVSAGAFFRSKNFEMTGVLNGHLFQNRPWSEKTGVGTDAYSFVFGEEPGKNVIYTSDTDSLDHLPGCRQKSKLLISECTHVDVETVIRFAEDQNIPEILFTHIHPEIEKIKDRYTRRSAPPSIDFANDGDSIEV